MSKNKINLISLDEWRRKESNEPELGLETKQQEVEESLDDLNQSFNNTVISYSEEEWKEVKGVGPTLAQRLCENGPFSNIEDVKKVKGIKPKIFENISEWYFAHKR